MVDLRAVFPFLNALARNMSASVGSSESTGLNPALSDPERWLRLPAVPGYEPHRVNDMLLLRPAASKSRGGVQTATAGLANQHVIFFPGDVQNFHKVMSSHHEHQQWQRWSLENVAELLSRRFPGSHVWVVRASRMYLHKFTCFDNFVESNLFGAPEHCSDYGAFRHLRALLGHTLGQAAGGGTPSWGFNRAVPPGPRASNGCPEGNSSSSVGSSPLLHCPVPSDLALTLVGFSKGCVVLNQLVYELRGARADPELAPFVASITDMYWLDGGHPGGSNTWVTSQEALKDLASSGIGVHSHVTPYEVCDPMRAWVGKEHKRFVRVLRELGVPIVDKLHFENQLPSLEQHFRVLEEF
ncbi:hypothetical protein AOXY_G12460 [Acipenser oxyrinchus oxyrinchus]|uniref:Uncharacterized protein n=1 Tax=Acipenser oxyrinchus oxyrinchus TaxID=40147 RepID=A0AAD8DA23_ACIOX|nr:hypothetical protein AOXY_G12460 [Acipenser oxyrinchus oxyrinchus]